MLRVRTGQKALRAVGGRLFFKLWESGKINRLEHTAGSSQNKGAEKLQRRVAPSPLEEGGRGRGKGQTQPREATPSHPANRRGFLSKDFLRPDRWRRQRALGPRREKAGRPNLWLPRPLAMRGCLARARRVLPTHSDICLQRPALPAAGLN